jgi:hypothetical protein
MAAALVLSVLLAGCTLPAQAPGTSTPALLDISTRAPATATWTLPPEIADPPPSAADTPPASTPEPAPTATPEPSPTPAQAARHLDIPNYSFTASYAYSAHTLEVTELITYTNPASETFYELVFVVEANRYYDSFALQSISADEQALGGYTLEDNRLSVPLLRPLAPGETLRLALAYTLVLPQIPEPSDTARPQPYGFTVRQANLVDFYPYIPLYQESTGWLSPEPGYFGEHQVLPLADYRVTLRIPEIGYPLTVAASAPAERQGDVYLYRMEAARSFAASISPAYDVLSGTVGTTQVYSYFFTFDVTGGQAALDHTMQALALYNELFGVYPHPTLSVVQADFLDGMEFDGLYFLSRGFYNIYDGTPAGYLTAIAVHETAHQWFYGLVGNNQATEPWLDEALCTYTERLYYERYYPELVPWWWAYRVDFYEPTGAVNATIYDYPGFRAYRDAVYLNGARFLEAVRQQMGDAAFFAALRDYTDQFRGGQATAPDFINTLGAHTDQDLTPRLAEYFK